MRNVIFNIVIYVLVPVVLIWGVMYYSWKGYNSYRINHYGQDAVAVITRKWDGTLYYDVEFETFSITFYAHYLVIMLFHVSSS